MKKEIFDSSMIWDITKVILAFLGAFVLSNIHWN
jgi:hypothetical protein